MQIVVMVPVGLHVLSGVWAGSTQADRVVRRVVAMGVSGFA